MDWGTAIIGIISILICIVPFLIYNYFRSKKEKRMLHVLLKNAQQQSCNISQHEFCGDFVVGIDQKRNFVFFSKQLTEKEISLFVDLNEIHACQISKKIKSAKNDNGNLSPIERVELSFLHKNRSKPDTRFELYTEETNMQLSGELQFADKWSTQINDRLRSKM